MKRMQFSVSSAAATDSLRCGVLSWGQGAGSVQTPATLLYTRAAAIPHITTDLLEGVFTSSYNLCQLCLPTV